MKNFIRLLVFVVLFGFMFSTYKVDKERRRLTYENKHLSEKLERYVERYELGDLKHTIKFTHSCGHKELFCLDLGQIQIDYLMQLQAHSCYECENKE